MQHDQMKYQQNFSRIWVKTCTTYYMSNYETGDIPKELIKNRIITLPKKEQKQNIIITKLFPNQGTF